MDAQEGTITIVAERVLYAKRYAQSRSASPAEHEEPPGSRVGIVGLPQLREDDALQRVDARTGAEVTAYAEVTQRPNLGMAVIADDRLDRLAEVIGSEK